MSRLNLARILVALARAPRQLSPQELHVLFLQFLILMNTLPAVDLMHYVQQALKSSAHLPI